MQNIFVTFESLSKNENEKSLAFIKGPYLFT